MDLIYGDCLEEMKKMQDNSIDCVITDLPYNIKYKKSQGLRNYEKNEANFRDFDLNLVLQESMRVCHGSFYFFSPIEEISDIVKFFYDTLSTRLFIWEKTNPSPMNGQYVWLNGLEYIVYAKKRGAIFNQHCMKPIFKCSRGTTKHHPTQKPIKLLKYLIESSTNENDTVLDFTMGSGSTGVACKEVNRNFIGIEKNEKYFKIAQERINNIKWK